MKSPDSDVSTDTRAALARLVRLYEHLTPDRRAQLEHYYAPDARFKDPFNEARGVDQCIHGATWVRFDAQGLVACHRDDWDAAEELYEKLPVIGRLMRWLRKMLSAK